MDLFIGSAWDQRMEFMYSAHLLLSFLLNNPLNGRFIWKRIPAKHKKASQELTAIWRIGKALFTKNLKDFYSAVDGYPWSQRIKPFVDALRDQKREQTIQLLAKGYSSIALERCGELLGLTPDQTVQALEGAGWTVDKAKGFAFPIEKSTAATKKDQQHSASSQLAQLTNYVSHLENF